MSEATTLFVQCCYERISKCQCQNLFTIFFASVEKNENLDEVYLKIEKQLINIKICFYEDHVS